MSLYFGRNYRILVQDEVMWGKEFKYPFFPPIQAIGDNADPKNPLLKRNNNTLCIGAEKHGPRVNIGTKILHQRNLLEK